MKILKPLSAAYEQLKRVQAQIVEARAELARLRNAIDELPDGRELWAVRTGDLEYVWIFDREPNLHCEDCFDTGREVALADFRAEHGLVILPGEMVRFESRSKRLEETMI